MKYINYTVFTVSKKVHYDEFDCFSRKLQKFSPKLLRSNFAIFFYITGIWEALSCPET